MKRWLNICKLRGGSWTNDVVNAECVAAGTTITGALDSRTCQRDCEAERWGPRSWMMRTQKFSKQKRGSERVGRLAPTPLRSPSFLQPISPQSCINTCVYVYVHAWPLLLKRKSNKSFQTALEKRGDITRSKRLPEVTPFLLHRQLHKLCAEAGADRNAGWQNGKALLPTASFQLISGQSFCKLTATMGLAFKKRSNKYQCTVPLHRLRWPWGKGHACQGNDGQPLYSELQAKERLKCPPTQAFQGLQKSSFNFTTVQLCLLLLNWAACFSIVLNRKGALSQEPREQSKNIPCQAQDQD